MIFKMRSEGKHCMRLFSYRKEEPHGTCHVGPSMIILENIIMRSLGYSGVIPLYARSGLRALVQVMSPEDGALTGLDCTSFLDFIVNSVIESDFFALYRLVFLYITGFTLLGQLFVLFTTVIYYLLIKFVTYTTHTEMGISDVDSQLPGEDALRSSQSL